jgi:hypothetical protein
MGSCVARFEPRLGQSCIGLVAVQHPYLKALDEGTLPDTRWALADFARNYYGYSSAFALQLRTTFWDCLLARAQNPAAAHAVL